MDEKPPMDSMSEIESEEESVESVTQEAVENTEESQAPENKSN